jgi:hypothetical protein
MYNQNRTTNMSGMGSDQRQRMMLANMLQQQQNNNQGRQQSSVDGIPAAVSPYQMLADSINSATQGYGAYGGQGDGGQLNQGGTMGAGQPGDANIRGNIMRSFNAPGGGSQMGYNPSMTGGNGSAGMMAGAGQMMSGVGKGFGDAMSGVGKGLGGIGKGLTKGIGGIGKLFG